MTTPRRTPHAFGLGILALIAALTGCATRPPDGIPVVPSFAVDRYLGTWYEIARLDHSFERGMSECRADYALRDDGAVAVVNRGWTGTRWKTATGRAVFTGERTVPSLSVTFFWPFSGGYHVIALDPDYRWAMVCGPDRSYLWILARTPTLDQEVRDRLVAQARTAGFATDQLIWVTHGQAPAAP